MKCKNCGVNNYKLDCEKENNCVVFYMYCRKCGENHSDQIVRLIQYAFEQLTKYQNPWWKRLLGL